MGLAGRHDGTSPHPFHDIDAINVANAASHVARSGQTVVVDNGGTVTLPGPTGGWVRIQPPDSVTWDPGVNGGPTITPPAGYTLPTVDLTVTGGHIDYWLPEGETAWQARQTFDRFIVQVIRWTPNPGSVAVIEVQPVDTALLPVGTPNYLTGIPLTDWAGDPGTLLDSRP